MHRRKTLTEYLKSLGYVQSRLDPCLYKLYEHGKLSGMMAIEVDDLLMVGNEHHMQRALALKDRFVLWKVGHSQRDP